MHRRGRVIARRRGSGSLAGAVGSGTGVAREPQEPGSPVGGIARDGMRRGGSRRAAGPGSRNCRKAGRWLGALLHGQQQVDPPLVATQRASVWRTRPGRVRSGRVRSGRVRSGRVRSGRVRRLRGGRRRRCFLMRRCLPPCRSGLGSVPGLRYRGLRCGGLKHGGVNHGGVKHGGVKHGGLGGRGLSGGWPGWDGLRCDGLSHERGRGLHQSPRTFTASALPSCLHLPAPPDVRVSISIRTATSCS
jgi:hypothetical protein